MVIQKGIGALTVSYLGGGGGERRGPIPRRKLPVMMGCMTIGLEQSQTVCLKDTGQHPSVSWLPTAGGVGHDGQFNLRYSWELL